MKTKFTGTISVLSEDDMGKMGLSKASVMKSAKSLMPETFDAEKNIDVLPVVFNLAVVNKFNANGDGIDAETAIAAVKRFANKPINIEHKKNKIVGHILNASLSDKEPDYNDNDIQSFAGRKDPFYITAAGLIYKHVYPELSQAIMKASDKEDSTYKSISTSWELAFKDYKVVYGSSDKLEDCQEADESMAKEMKQYIKGFGGKGMDEKGNSVHRLIVGETHPLGAALTRNPAAEVSGVYLMDEEDEMEDEEEEEDNEMEEENDDEEEDKQQIQQKNSLIAKNIVKIKKFKDILNMNDKQFEQFLQKLDESLASVTTEETQAKSIALLVKDAITESSESWKSQVQAEKEAKEKLESDLAQLQASFLQAKEELDQLKADAAVKAAAELFNSRMNSLESEYEFSDEELSFVTAEVKNLDESEEAFEQYKQKAAIIFAHKSKAFIQKTQEEVQAKIEEEVAKRLQSKASKTETEPEETEEETELELEESNASIPNNNAEASVKQSLIEKLKQNFSVEVKI